MLVFTQIKLTLLPYQPVVEQLMCVMQLKGDFEASCVRYFHNSKNVSVPFCCWNNLLDLLSECESAG